MSSKFPTRRKTVLGGHNGPVHALTYSALQSQYLLTGSTDRLIRIFNPSHSSPKAVQTYQGHAYEVLDIAVSSDNSRFASVGGDKTVFLWDVTRAEVLKRFSGHSGRCNAVMLGGEDDSVVISGSFDATVKFWDTKSNSTKPLLTLSEAKDSVSSLAVAGHHIFAGSIDGRVRTYDIRVGEVYTDFIGAPVTSVTTTNQADSVLVSTLDSTLRLMDRRDGKCLKTYKGEGFVNETYRIRSTLGAGDAFILSGSENGEIFIWDLLEGTVRHQLRHNPDSERKPRTGKQDVISAVTYCPTRMEWASAGGDGKVVVWATD